MAKRGLFQLTSSELGKEGVVLTVVAWAQPEDNFLFRLMVVLASVKVVDLAVLPCDCAFLRQSVRSLSVRQLGVGWCPLQDSCAGWEKERPGQMSVLADRMGIHRNTCRVYIEIHAECRYT